MMAGNIELYDACGYLEIIKGPMFSGKTTRLLDIYKKYSFCEIETMVINYEKDNRYSDIFLSSHDKVMIPCIKASHLNELVQFKENHTIDPHSKYVNNFIKAKIILINEGQFFDDIVPWVTTAVEQYHKNVYICGLNSDFKRNKFGNWLDLELISDNIVMLHSFCSHCKKRPAIFSHRVKQETDVVEVIGGAEAYIPVCRKCYNSLITPARAPVRNTITVSKKEDMIIAPNIHYYPLKKC
jgi:thymidine kinase